MSNLYPHLKHKPAQPKPNSYGNNPGHNPLSYKSISRLFSISRLWLVGLIVIFAAVGAYLLVISRAATSLSADFNGDGTVNILDLSILATNWGKTGQTTTTGDTNNDGLVNIYDLSNLAGQWGQVITQPSSINVKDYGAKGDGVTNDTAAIASAETAAAKISGSTVYFPAGTYIVTSFTFAPNMNFSGDGFSSWIEGQILMNTGDNIQNMALGANGYTIELISGTPVNNLQVTNVDFRGGGGMVNDAVDGVFTIDTGQTLTNSTFTNVTIETNSDGIGDGISMVTNGLPQSMLHDVTFQGLDIKSQPCMGFALDDRTYLGTPTTDNYNINIINSIIEPSGSESISIEGGNNLLIQGNTFMGSGTSSVYPWHQTLEFNGSTSAKAIGNTFYRSDSAWLNLHCTNCTFKSNVFDDTVNYINTPSVAHDQSGWGATCSGCTFQYNEMTMDTGGAFFYFSSSSNTNIIDNIFWDQRNPTIECGIYLYYGSTNINLTGNTFYNKYKWYSDYSTCINLYEDSTINSSNNTYLSPTAITSLPPVHAP